MRAQTTVRKLLAGRDRGDSHTMIVHKGPESGVGKNRIKW